MLDIFRVGRPRIDTVEFQARYSFAEILREPAISHADLRAYLEAQIPEHLDKAAEPIEWQLDRQFAVRIDLKLIKNVLQCIDDNDSLLLRVPCAK